MSFVPTNPVAARRAVPLAALLLATVVIGGLVSATFLTLFVLPTVYAFVYRKEEPTPPSGSGEPAADDGSDLARAEGA